tara:strand:- start:451 stop:957 length:507 start_codon:yes stop_codon:yes gene_type:complete
MIIINTKKTHELKKKEIESITKLKNTHWNYGEKSQIKWFKKYIKKSDIHNILLFKNKIIGYTCLRVRRIHSKKYKKYLYFDTLIINKKFRKLSFSKTLMIFNNKIIKNNKKISFLITTKKLETFYKKFGWKTLNKNNFRVIDHKTQANKGMIFNNHQKLSNFSFYLYE